MIPNIDRLRGWFDSTPNYVQTCTGELVDSVDGQLVHCFLGIGADHALKSGAEVELVRTPAGPEYRAARAWGDGDNGSMDILDRWYGVVLFTIAPQPEDLPHALRARIEALVDRVRVEDPDTARGFATHLARGLGYPLHMLNDAGLSLADCADAARCSFGMDLHKVEGTAEHALAAHAAAEVDTWGASALVTA